MSLYEPLFGSFLGDVEAYDRNGRVRGRTGNRHPSAAPRNVHATADGYVTLSASSQAVFENVAAAIDRLDLLDDERFATNDDRVENAAALDAAIEAWASERPTEAVVATMGDHDAIVGPVYDVADAFEDDQYRAREDIVAVEDPELGELRTAAPVPKFSRTPGEVDHAGPRHGHTTRRSISEKSVSTNRSTSGSARRGSYEYATRYDYGPATGRHGTRTGNGAGTTCRGRRC